jgi:hypothetical protein
MIKEQFMRAIRFNAFGDPSVLELAEAADPAVRETTALVRVMAASINPSARMSLLIGAILLIAGCAGYNESRTQELRREGEIKAQETGQPSMLQGWRPQYEGAI